MDRTKVVENVNNIAASVSQEMDKFKVYYGGFECLTIQQGRMFLPDT
jgi:hypothetical protein